jgi:ABC-type multidrug transport system ATPase subunit
LLQAIAGAIGISEGKIAYFGTSPGAKISPGALPPRTVKMPIPEAQFSDIMVTGSHPVLPGKEIAPEGVYRRLSIAAPYLEVIEEMTVTEFLHFHGGFKPFLPGWSIQDIIERVGLETAAHKQIRYYSSGMRQRVRLAQAIFSDTALVLLDEPCTNLDVDGIALYRSLVEVFCPGRTIIVSSNDRQEYDFCEESINIMDHKS